VHYLFSDEKVFPAFLFQKHREDLGRLASKRLDHLADMLKDFVPLKELEPANTGMGSRERLYSKVKARKRLDLNTLWSHPGCRDRESVRR